MVSQQLEGFVWQEHLFPPIQGYTGQLILIQHNFPCVPRGDHATNYWKMPINLLHTVPLKSKLIVTGDLA